MRAVVQGQTLVAIDGVPTGTAVVAGRLGQLREGTAVAAQTAQAVAPAAPASVASGTAQ